MSNCKSHSNPILGKNVFLNMINDINEYFFGTGYTSFKCLSECSQDGMLRL